MLNILLGFLQQLIITTLLLFYLKFKFANESWKLINQAVLLGFITLLFLFLLDQIAVIKGIDQLKSIKQTGYYSFVEVRFSAELGKFILLRYYFLKQKTFKGPLDGIIYSLLISGSFTAISLPLFMTGWFSKPMDTTFLITYPIANLAFATIMGFFTGMGKYRQNRFIDSMTGLGAASFFHGFYFFINLTDENLIFALYGAGLLLISLMLLVKSTNIKEQEKTLKV
ncbi:MAG: hypothetical protein FD155_2215 [Bacteroidetes bacterium]|nr:MAG: hypothetical protein FD155_2215 [Bacteroidota bacterium]